MMVVRLFFCCVSLILLTDVSCQSSCPPRSPCVTANLCPEMRMIPNWRETIQTCGFTTGRIRRPLVCCPSPGRSAPNPVFNSIPSSSSASGCGIAKTAQMVTTFVLGGKDSEPGEWPWMVAIMRTKSNGEKEPWCTGSLIDRKHVLTAAHCFNGSSTPGMETRIGDVDFRRGRPYSIQTIKVHEGYKPGQYYDDIAVLTLNREVGDPDVVPICLPNSRIARKNFEGKGLTVAGWGAERSRGVMSNVLKHLTGIPVQSNTLCNTQYFGRRGRSDQFPQGITSGFLCAGYLQGGKDSCNGDSGGPLMHQEDGRWYQIGIVSFGYFCGIPGYSGGYTRVSRYLTWIQNALRN